MPITPRTTPAERNLAREPWSVLDYLACVTCCRWSQSWLSTGIDWREHHWYVLRIVALVGLHCLHRFCLWHFIIHCAYTSWRLLFAYSHACTSPCKTKLIHYSVLIHDESDSKKTINPSIRHIDMTRKWVIYFHQIRRINGLIGFSEGD